METKKDNDFWKGLEAIHLNHLAASLIIIKAKHGVLACGYLSIDAFNHFKEVAVVVSKVSNFDDVLNAKPRLEQISIKAAKIYNITPDMTGREIIERFKYEA